MIRKCLIAVTSVLFAGAFIAASSVETKAALPSTYDIINDANGNIADATANYNAAKADEAAKLARFNEVKNNPAHSQLEYEIASFDYTNAVNVSRWWLEQINNSNAYLTNITGRGAFEDKFAANKAALADLTTLQASKTVADGAANIANGVAARIADTQKAIEGYKQQLATSPSVQKQIDELSAQLVQLQAEYAAKAASAGDLAGAFYNNLNTLNYQSYSKGFEDYQFRREYERDNLKWNPKGYY